MPTADQSTAAFTLGDLPATQAAIFADIIEGGFPAVVAGAFGPEERRRFYSSYVQTYLERDVAALDGVRNLREFELFFRLLAARAGLERSLAAARAIDAAAVAREHPGEIPDAIRRARLAAIASLQPPTGH